MNLPTIKIYAKPHVAQYLRARFLEADQVLHIPNDHMLIPSIAACLTEDPQKRHKNQPPETRHQLECLEALLPARLQRYFVNDALLIEMTKLIELYFWVQVEIFVYRILTDQMQVAYKEDAIKAFYNEYGLTESLYPIGSFRKKLYRMQVRGVRPELPENITKVPRRISNKLTNQQCMQIYRLKTQHKKTYPVIAVEFGVHEKTVFNIVKKISKEFKNEI